MTMPSQLSSHESPKTQWLGGTDPNTQGDLVHAPPFQNKVQSPDAHL